MIGWWRKGWGGVDGVRRRLLGRMAVLGGVFVAGGVARADQQAGGNNDFPGDAPEHRVVYQLNKPDADYHDHIVFSVGAMLRQYGDNIRIAVVAFGPGIHVLLNKPRRPVTPTVREKLASLADYGVEFYACGNTLKSLKLGEQDVVPYAQVVEVGASKLMELQKQGYAYISW
jgi:intracellular sulfur oxidation DsrE/DsrF family protein